MPGTTPGASDNCPTAEQPADSKITDQIQRDIAERRQTLIVSPKLRHSPRRCNSDGPWVRDGFATCLMLVRRSPRAGVSPI